MSSARSALPLDARVEKRPCRLLLQMTNLVVHSNGDGWGLDFDECRQCEYQDSIMPSATYKIAEARAHFSELLARARAGEEIVITKGLEPHARLVPPVSSEVREAAPLQHLSLPDDLFDGDDPEQAAIDAGDCNDALGIWQGRSISS